MQRYKYEEVTKKEKIYLSHLCDLCGAEIENLHDGQMYDLELHCYYDSYGEDLGDHYYAELCKSCGAELYKYLKERYGIKFDRGSQEVK